MLLNQSGLIIYVKIERMSVQKKYGRLFLDYLALRPSGRYTLDVGFSRRVWSINQTRIKCQSRERSRFGFATLNGQLIHEFEGG
jgi:hypothetical protein